MRVLVTGARGLLGAAIVRAFADTDLHAFGHGDFDVTSESAVSDAFARVRPEVVINCAAYNDVDRAEQHADAALSTNAFGVLALARAARDHDAVLVHYSTDFVFDGESTRPYVEEDPPNPRNVYAVSKLLGEWFAADCPRAYILRVDALFGHPGPNGARLGSLGTIVDRVGRGDVVPVFVDRTVSPSYTEDVARTTRDLISQRPPTGLYHCVNSGFATWMAIAEEASRVMRKPLRVQPLTLETANLAARRPRYCALSPAKLGRVGIVMPSWEDALKRYLLRDRSSA